MHDQDTHARKIRAIRLWTLMVLLPLGARAFAAVDTLPSASSRQHAWIAAPTGQNNTVIVQHLPPSPRWGELRPGIRLAERPIALAANADELFIVLRPGQAGSDHASTAVLPLRSTRATPVPGGAWQYDRLRILPPIPLLTSATNARAAESTADPDPQPPSRLDLIAFVVAGGAGPDARLPIALLRHADQDAPPVLRLLARDGWRDVPLPPTMAGRERVWLVATGQTIALAERSPRPGSIDLRVWSTDAASLLASSEPEPEPQRDRTADLNANNTADTHAHHGQRDGWSHWTTPVPPGLFELLAIDGQLVLLTGVQADGRRRILSLRPGGTRPITDLAPDPSGSIAVVGIGQALGVVEFAADNRADRPMIRIFSLAGTPLHDGEARTLGPVTAGEFGLLILMLLSLFASIIVFIARPVSTWNPPITLPPGTSLASPGRRLLAMVLDLAPGMFASSVLFPTAAAAAPLASFGGVVPLLFVIAFTLVHQSIGEMMGGRTLGKLVLGLRTINAEGQRPSLPQALLRTIVKLTCPPLMFFTLANPYMPGPAGFGTVVIVAESPDRDTHTGTGNDDDHRPDQPRH